VPHALPRPRATAPFDVLAIGENSLDYVGITAPDRRGASGRVRRPLTRDKTPLARLEQHSGGQAATAAVAAARLGCRASYVGSFGDDDRAATIRRALAREQVDVVVLARRHAETRAALVLVDGATGERTVYEFRDPALPLTPDDLAPDLVTRGRLLLLDATSLEAATVAARAARAAGVPTIVDVDTMASGVGDLLAAIDVIVVPAPFLSEYTGLGDVGRALAALAREVPAAATIVTLGRDGSLSRVEGREIRTPGFAVEVVDTTGAGDAFRGGLAAAWLRLGETARIEDLLAFANATAALNCMAVGAQAGLPAWDVVERLVTGRPHAQSK